jgi:hypothetical protein
MKLVFKKSIVYLLWLEAVFLSLRTHALTLPLIKFTLRSVQTHISMQNCIEMCVCTLLKANPMRERVRAHTLGKINFNPTPKYGIIFS